jgi:hypothetical protein
MPVDADAVHRRWHVRPRTGVERLAAMPAHCRDAEFLFGKFAGLLQFAGRDQAENFVQGEQAGAHFGTQIGFCRPASVPAGECPRPPARCPSGAGARRTGGASSVDSSLLARKSRAIPAKTLAPSQLLCRKAVKQRCGSRSRISV